MLKIQHGTPARNCQGISRRSAIKAGFLGLSGLTLADLFRLRAQGAATKKETAAILIWLDGGPSQLETYDPKPEAPSDYRGPYDALATNVRDIHFRQPAAAEAGRQGVLCVAQLFPTARRPFRRRAGCSTGRVRFPTPSAPAGSLLQSGHCRGPRANQPEAPGVRRSPAATSTCCWLSGARIGQSYNPFDCVNRDQCYLSASFPSPISPPRCLENFATGEAGQSAGGVNLLAGWINPAESRPGGTMTLWTDTSRGGMGG
jgi:hypothetical protein